MVEALQRQLPALLSIKAVVDDSALQLPGAADDSGAAASEPSHPPPKHSAPSDGPAVQSGEEEEEGRGGGWGLPTAGWIGLAYYY